MESPYRDLVSLPGILPVEIIDRATEVAQGSPIWTATGFDAALIGYARRGRLVILAYDAERTIGLIESSYPELELGPDEDARGAAEEDFSHNLAGSWIGEGTPIFLDPICAACGETEGRCECSVPGPFDIVHRVIDGGLWTRVADRALTDPAPSAKMGPNTSKTWRSQPCN